MTQPVQTMPWEVVSVEETSTFDRTRGPIPSLRINFRMADGTHSYVIVPRENADSDAIQSQIHELATTLTQILQLGTPADFNPYDNQPYTTPPPQQ